MTTKSRTSRAAAISPEVPAGISLTAAPLRSTNLERDVEDAALPAPPVPAGMGGQAPMAGPGDELGQVDAALAGRSRIVSSPTGPSGWRLSVTHKPGSTGPPTPFTCRRSR